MSRWEGLQTAASSVIDLLMLVPSTLSSRELTHRGLVAVLILATAVACSSGDAQNENTGAATLTGGGTSGDNEQVASAGSTDSTGNPLTTGTSTSSTDASTSSTDAGPSSGTTSPSVSTTSGGGATGSGATETSAGGADGASTVGGTGGTGGSDEVDATAMVDALGVGTNIGNTLENTTTWETGWGQPLISQAYIDGIASRGIKTVRIPVAWDTYANDGVIASDKLSRVKEVVGWIEDAGMYPIVNIHWDGGWIFNEGTADQYRLTDAVKTKFASYWHQIATGFADVGHKLIFEGLNEEAKFYVDGNNNGQPDYAALNELNQLFVTTVRAETGYNPTRALLIAGFATDIALTCVDEFAVPDDPAGPGKLFLSLHYYTPYTFCGLETVESWGTPATTWGTDAERAELENLFDTASTFSANKNLPIILGEFAVTVGTTYPRDPASRVLWMTSVAEAAVSRGMVPVLWDTGSEIDRTDGSFSPEFQAVMDSVATP